MKDCSVERVDEWLCRLIDCIIYKYVGRFAKQHSNIAARPRWAPHRFFHYGQSERCAGGLECKHLLQQST
jgi:hypothetical protein